jgi:hypothetical protein
MNNKKQVILTCIIILCCTNIFAQQQNKKTTTEQKYKWAATFNLGDIFVLGDVKPIKTKLHIGFTLYKPITKWFGFKFNYTGGNAKGQDYFGSENFAKNTALNDKYAAPVRTNTGPIVYGYYINNNFVNSPTGRDIVYYNYKSTINTFVLSAQLTLPLPYADPKFDLYLNYGVGIMFHNTRVNALNNDGKTYATFYKDLFARSFTSGLSKYEAEKLTRKELKNNLDNTYETAAEGDKNKPTKIYKLGLGFSYKINSRMKLGIERTALAANYDLIDGHRWQEESLGDAILSRDIDGVVTNSFTFTYLF